MSFYLPFGIIGVLFGLTAYTFYFRAIFRGETRPHLYTWLIWGTLGTTASIVSFRNNGGWGMLVPTMMGILNTTIAIVAIFYGEKRLNQKDKILLGMCGLMFLFWFITKDDLITILIACIIESIGFYFTWKKSYSAPLSEDLKSYIIWTFEFLFAILAIENINVTNGLYPSYLFISELAFVVYLIWRRNIVKK